MERKLQPRAAPRVPVRRWRPQLAEARFAHATDWTADRDARRRVRTSLTGQRGGCLPDLPDWVDVRIHLVRQRLHLAFRSYSTPTDIWWRGKLRGRASLVGDR